MLQVTGSVTYNDRGLSEFQTLRTSGYVEQVDSRLIPELTVRFPHAGLFRALPGLRPQARQAP